MRYFYLLANGQPNDRAIYYTGQEAFHGGELWGNIHEAHRFESLADVCYHIANRNDACASPIIVEIADVTFDKCVQGYKDFMNGFSTEAKGLMHKYNTVSYITNSIKEV